MKTFFPQLAWIVCKFCFHFMASPIQAVKIETFPVNMGTVLLVLMYLSKTTNGKMMCG